MDPKVIVRFKELVDAGTIEEELHKQASMNWRLRVRNKKKFWIEHVNYKGWAIQQRKGPIHGPYNHFRILDPRNVRHAFGTEAYISKRIMGISINKLTEIVTEFKDALRGDSSPSKDQQVFDEFDRLVDSGKIEERLKDQASTNIDWGTKGGKVCWEDLHVHKGWRIQQNCFFSNCRILDPHDIRKAWGIKRYVFRRIMGQPLNIVVNYLHNPQDAENSFAFYPTLQTPHKGSVILVHGWGCRAINMEWLAQSLTQFGYDAYCYDYQSSRYSIQELGESLLSNMQCLIQELPVDENIHILTHSMGGLLVRKMLELDTEGLEDAEEGDCVCISERLNRIVMLGPPNKGSLWADLVVLAGGSLVNRSIEDMKFIDDSAVKIIGRPKHYSKPFGIIAGTFDFKVFPQDSVHIPNMHENIDYILVKVSANHYTLRTSYDALSYAVKFFESGCF